MTKAKEEGQGCEIVIVVITVISVVMAAIAYFLDLENRVRSLEGKPPVWTTEKRQ